MAHTYTNLVSHVIFSTKGRLPCIDDDLKPELLGYMVGILRKFRGFTLIINAMPDHVHWLIQLPSSISLAEIMRTVKANSSRWVHETRPDIPEFGWQTGYGAFSVSKSNVPVVARYIANQERHHRKVAFQEEFLEYLKRNELEYDTRYIWE